MSTVNMKESGSVLTSIQDELTNIRATVNQTLGLAALLKSYFNDKENTECVENVLAHFDGLAELFYKEIEKATTTVQKIDKMIATIDVVKNAGSYKVTFEGVSNENN
jgi:sulfite reductase alpha subunit-like flavoprotein